MDRCGDQQLYSNAFRRIVSSRAGLNEQRKARPQSHSHIPAVTDGALPRPSVAKRLSGYKGQRVKRARAA